MGKIEENEIDGTLFPIKQKNREIIYFFSDFKEFLGNGEAGDVYKGYRCIPKTTKTEPFPYRISKNELTILEDKPVAIKIYKEGKFPSDYQITNESIAVVDIEDRAVLIMEFSDGFHIEPDFKKNTELKDLTFLQAVDVAWQLVIGLNPLHYRNTKGSPVVHGDINGSNIKIKKVTEKRTDVFFLDFDYAKPILTGSQHPQGTPEFVALEILDGYYSESSDFYALAPVLLSLFGANNPLREIFNFRDTHPEMTKENLIRQYAQIGFCSDGLFSHFEPKPSLEICNLLENFIKRMGTKEKSQRPSSDAILEFFTSLRQWCLVKEDPKLLEFYLVRLYIASNNERWLKEERYITVFSELTKNVQDRLICLMSFDHYIHFYKCLPRSDQYQDILTKLEYIIVSTLAEKSSTLKKSPSLINTLFKGEITQQEIKWLLHCFESHDRTEFFAPKNEQYRRRLEQCKQLDMAPLISALIYGLDKGLQPERVTRLE